MSAEACAFALKNALTEIKTVCPEVTNTFIFRENGDIVAQDEDTSPFAVHDAKDALKSVAEKAGAIGGLESVTFRGARARAAFSKFEDFYGANVS